MRIQGIVPSSRSRRRPCIAWTNNPSRFGTNPSKFCVGRYSVVQHENNWSRVCTRKCSFPGGGNNPSSSVIIQHEQDSHRHRDFAEDRVSLERVLALLPLQTLPLPPASFSSPSGLKLRDPIVCEPYNGPASPVAQVDHQRTGQKHHRSRGYLPCWRFRRSLCHPRHTKTVT